MLSAACVFLFVVSCSSAKAIWLTDRHHKKESSTGEQLYPSGIHSPRYVTFTGGGSPYAVINNKAANMILDGKFPQAEVLLADLAKDEPGRGDAFNNLAVIYECAGDYDKACDNYLRACMIDPDNRYYRLNFSNAGAFRDEN